MRSRRGEIKNTKRKRKLKLKLNWKKNMQLYKRAKMEKAKAFGYSKRSQCSMSGHAGVQSSEGRRRRTKRHTRSKTVADNEMPSPMSPMSYMSPISQAVTTSSAESIAELFKVLAGALSASRIPAPEPSVSIEIQ